MLTLPLKFIAQGIGALCSIFLSTGLFVLFSEAYPWCVRSLRSALLDADHLSPQHYRYAVEMVVPDMSLLSISYLFRLYCRDLHLWFVSA